MQRSAGFDTHYTSTRSRRAHSSPCLRYKLQACTAHAFTRNVGMHCACVHTNSNLMRGFVANPPPPPPYLWSYQKQHDTYWYEPRSDPDKRISSQGHTKFCLVQDNKFHMTAKLVLINSNRDSYSRHFRQQEMLRKLNEERKIWPQSSSFIAVLSTLLIEWLTPLHSIMMSSGPTFWSPIICGQKAKTNILWKPCLWHNHSAELNVGKRVNAAWKSTRWQCFGMQCKTMTVVTGWCWSVHGQSSSCERFWRDTWLLWMCNVRLWTVTDNQERCLVTDWWCVLLDALKYTSMEIWRYWPNISFHLHYSFHTHMGCLWELH